MGLLRRVAHPCLNVGISFNGDGALVFFASRLKIADHAEQMLFEIRAALIGLVIAIAAFVEHKFNVGTGLEFKAALREQRAFKSRRFANVAMLGDHLHKRIDKPEICPRQSFNTHAGFRRNHVQRFGDE